MLTANSYGDTAMPSQVSSALRSRSTASCERRSRKQATSWRWPILAVVLGLFAHSEALAQRLTSLDVTGTGLSVKLDSALAENDFDYTVIPDVPDGDPVPSLNALTDLTVNASADTGYTVTYDPGATVTSLPVGRTLITVTVTSDSDSTETQDYGIAVTRPADTTLASLELAFAGGTYLDGEMPPRFVPETLNYEAIVTAATTAVTVTVEATSPTAEPITWDSSPWKKAVR